MFLAAAPVQQPNDPATHWTGAERCQSYQG